MSNKNVNLIKEFLSTLPKKHNDKNLDLIYRHGYVIAILAKVCDHNPKVREWIEHKITDSK